MNWEKSKTEPEVRYIPAIIRFLGHDPFPAPQTLGERIVRTREGQGISRKRLAAKLGVDEGALAGWEKGLREPQAKYRAKLRTFLQRG
ncbi:MAG: helix-turn-helix transcriptional regulator [Parvibaculum sp.]|uniref:helix-turn-helix domain-containing protein n=1 Tax=Parvibaculum sp. TaxID=2024848 RepID=UPI00284029EF|nr:helix-turn-helix transcriptional regulator [Parvibaculum sp.]MDR3500702.1 helix-turn-helix transcriptional regulator [Parvibaculum sp.]